MGGWRILTLSGGQRDPKRPTLLIKHHFEPTQYVIYLTDLVHIWEESLDRRGIIRRALNEGTSIDPSEGPDQLRLLLKHIRDVADGNTGRLRLQESDKPSCLKLQLEVDLPIPLEPLRWAVSLEQQSNDVMFDRLQIPLFKHCFRREAEVESLLQRIRERDNAISRLIDKLETAGIDLASIFPGAGNPRGARAAAGKDSLLRAVPALRPFDEPEWRRMIDDVKWQSREDLLSKAFAVEDGLSGTEEWALPGEWWNSVGPSGVELKTPANDDLKASFSSMVSFGMSASGLTDDDFQVQDVSKLSRNQLDTFSVQVKDSQVPSAQAPHADDDSTTEDDDDDDDLDATPSSPPRHTVSPAKKESPIKPPPIRKLGMIGGKAKQPAKSPSPTPHSMEIDGSSSRDVLVPNSVPEPAAAQPRRKIGRIGGLLSKPSKDTADLPLRSSQEREVEDAEAVKKEPDGDARRSRPAARTATKTPPRETSTERADRKRQELKRELEEKRQAPAKKKRKF